MINCKNIKTTQVYLILIIVLILPSTIIPQQIEINRISQMKDFPNPYLMRDWKEVAKGYDSLVFNYTLSGDYLPLLFFRNNTVNYPGEISFGLHTYVGTVNQNSGEAINALPAVIGATLVGVDKSNQNGYDWVKMCREYFNNRPEQNVYKNHPVDDSFQDWWYSTMPNIFFYQLYDLYPNTPEFSYQLQSVAEQWLRAVEKMGGSATPWARPYMNYRGWDLATMSPYNVGVKEPEAAGAIAWLLYHAYKETGNINYRIGAEWAMEFLNNLVLNPAYELQLSFGTYIAAKMNAELGTNYNTEKFLNWCFDVGGLRSWGAILGTWGGKDVDGLIGEVNGNNDYAFLMNTTVQISTLIPLLRYDGRFANSIGKWVLNAANASRLFYSNFLPSKNQDSRNWSEQYDTNSYIGYEAIRELAFDSSPYATGDAIKGGWANTNLALYGSSPVGILGGIVDTTNVEGILKLDMIKTDYFNDEAYPTFLLYNPYDEEKFANFDLGLTDSDIYESLSNTFLLNNSTGIVQINIQSKKSVIIVIIPSGLEKKYVLNKLIVDDRVIDYNTGKAISNYPPRIKSLMPEEQQILFGDSVNIYCTADDLDENILSYSWSTSTGLINGNGDVVSWSSGNDEGDFEITVIVNDNMGGADTANTIVSVVNKINQNPIIASITAEPRKINLGEQSILKCDASDIDDSLLTFIWISDLGEITGNGAEIIWSAPKNEGNYVIICKVQDNSGGESVDSIIVSVRDLSIQQTGQLICYYPFTGNAFDESGNNNNGIINGAVSVSDRFSNGNSALSFDGKNDNVLITNNDEINFTDAVSINFWVKINNLFDREQYIISHGNWERRWKISISNNRLRFTIRTSTGIVDLDSELILEPKMLYNITAIYNGTELEIYIDGKLNSFKYWDGKILTTDIDLMIGQVLPGNYNYNFNGELDDIRIYDYALPKNEVEQLYDISTGNKTENVSTVPIETSLYQNYPNPFNGQTKITYQIKNPSEVSLIIYDILGRRLNILVNENKNAGKYSVVWDSKDSSGRQLSSGIYFMRLRADSYSETRKIILLQ